jgi:hypothetical protein
MPEGVNLVSRNTRKTEIGISKRGKTIFSRTKNNGRLEKITR